ncbi:DUF2510 domain-containing protein [Streptacidiphilus neutrinimicus]|uniref:DUF2510 domain-containing protein n=1 Tax=Streptacidiphilus neutrinimicus TaxID=105420 RepID=UPI00137768E1|nr:DUF2510 domain-containing protein [Streptacidiphilus neutrinimicus]
MSETAPPPAGWYPDPKPADPDNPGKRWWNGSEWTVSTRTDDTTVFISGEPPAAKRVRRPGPLLVGAVAAVVGLGVGSLVTYFAMDGDGQSGTAAGSRSFAGGGGQNGGDGLNPFGGSGGHGGTGGSNGGGGQNGGGSGSGSNLAVDVADGVSVPLPSGWTGGTTTDGHASGSYGSYTCAGSGGSSGGSSSGNTCSYAGANTETLKTPVSTGVQAAAEQDITAAVKESYGDVTGHQVLQEKAVTVAGRSGYLVRWQVDAKVGNNGTVETVVFPDKAGDKLIALHLGFDIANKAPSVSVMDQIVSGVADFSGGSLRGGQAPGTS